MRECATAQAKVGIFASPAIAEVRDAPRGGPPDPVTGSSRG